MTFAPSMFDPPLWYDRMLRPITPNTYEHFAREQANKGEVWRVALDHIGDVMVSTMFLGLDHSFTDGPPVLFETMTFSVARFPEPIMVCGFDEQYRYHTEPEAIAWHAYMVGTIRTHYELPPGGTTDDVR